MSTQKSEDLMRSLIRKEFDKKHEVWSDRPNDLIELAKKYGFNDLANEMQKDL